MEAEVPIKQNVTFYNELSELNVETYCSVPVMEYLHFNVSSII